MPIAMTQEQRALQASLRDRAMQAGPTQILPTQVAERVAGLPR